MREEFQDMITKIKREKRSYHLQLHLRGVVFVSRRPEPVDAEMFKHQFLTSSCFLNIEDLHDLFADYIKFQNENEEMKKLLKSIAINECCDCTFNKNQCEACECWCKRYAPKLARCYL